MAVIAVVGAVGVGLVYALDRQPAAGETRLAEGLRVMAGGKASNHALGLAQFGHRVRLLSALGEDAFAEIARAAWRAHGVDDSAITVHAGKATMVGVVWTDHLGDNRVVIGPNVLNLFTPNCVDADEAAIRSADAVLVSLEMPIASGRRALELARRAGVLTVLNPAPAPSRDDVAAIVELCDWITPNKGEAEAMTGAADPSVAAAKLRRLGVRHVAVTLGAEGVLYAGADGEEHIPSPKVPVLDTSGAGDAFNVALVDALVTGCAPRTAVAHGCAAGARIVQGPGFLDALDLLADLAAPPVRCESARSKGAPMS